MEVQVLRGGDVERLLTMEEAIKAVEEALRDKVNGAVQMPSKTYLNFPEYQGDLRTMPAYLSREKTATVKIVNSHPLNRKFGLPTVIAFLILVDPETGMPKALMNATWLTAMRTGAVGAIASEHLAKPKPEVLCIIGAGVQAPFQLEAHRMVFPGLSDVKVWDLNPDASRRFVGQCSKKYPEIVFEASASAEEAVRRADIVITVTPSRQPIVMDSWVSEGTHINAIGADAPGKQELDPKILKRAKIVVDDFEQAEHGGEINVPVKLGLLSRREVYCEIGEIVVGRKEGRTSPSEVTVFCSTGLAIQDAATATVVYRKALTGNIGLKIDLL